MSIAEKLVKIAENEPKVFEAGKTGTIKGVEPAHINTNMFQDKMQTIANNTLRVYEAGQRFANGLKTTVSGSVIRVDDVNSVEHNLGVKLTSDTITDFLTVEVSRYGKNLIPHPYTDSSVSMNGGTITANDDGTVTISGTPTGYCGMEIYKGNALVSTGTYTISLGKEASGIRLTLFLYDENKNTVNQFNIYPNVPLTINFNDYPTVRTWNMTFARLMNGTAMTGIVYPQLELGTVATTYEPYIEPQTETANADGIVEGLTSLSPSMTLISNSNEVIIEMEYFRDIDLALENQIIEIAMSGGE